MRPPDERRPGPETEAAGELLAGARDTDTVSQPSLLDAEGRALADLGGDLARRAVHTSWRIACDGAIADLAATGEPFTAEDVRERVGVMTGRESAMGGAFRAAAREGLILAAGWRTASRPEAHQRALRVWRGAS